MFGPKSYIVFKENQDQWTQNGHQFCFLDVCLFSTQTTALLSQWKHTCELVSLWANVFTDRKIGYNSSTAMSYVFHEGGHWPWIQCVPYVPPNPQSEASVYICMLLNWTSGEKLWMSSRCSVEGSLTTCVSQHGQVLRSESCGMVF